MCSKIYYYHLTINVTWGVNIGVGTMPNLAKLLDTSITSTIEKYN